MKLPSWIYRSERVGKNGRPFSLYKFRTLKEDFSGDFATEESYTRFGRFLRKSKLDELPQLLNLIKGDLSLVGPRPENAECIDLIPKDIRKILLSVKPGLTSLSSVHFYNEEELLREDGYEVYYERIKPIKLILDCFYIEHRGLLLKLWIIWRTFVLVLKSLCAA